MHLLNISKGQIHRLENTEQVYHHQKKFKNHQWHVKIIKHLLNQQIKIGKIIKRRCSSSPLHNYISMHPTQNMTYMVMLIPQYTGYGF